MLLLSKITHRLFYDIAEKLLDIANIKSCGIYVYLAYKKDLNEHNLKIQTKIMAVGNIQVEHWWDMHLYRGELHKTNQDSWLAMLINKPNKLARPTKEYFIIEILKGGIISG